MFYFLHLLYISGLILFSHALFAQDPILPVGLNFKMYNTIQENTMPLIDSSQKEKINRRQVQKTKASVMAYNFSTDFTPATNGEWRNFSGKYRSWLLKIRSHEAHGLGLVLSEMQLLPGEKLYVYNLNGFAGSFDSDNIPASGVLPLKFLKGEEIVIEYDVPAENAGTGTFKIATVSHAYRDIFSDPESGLQRNKSTNEDECYKCFDGPSLRQTKKSVVKLTVYLDDAALICTGTLVNNTALDKKAYILTAQHCIATQADAERTIFSFNYEDVFCAEETAAENLTIYGSMYRASLFENDFTLIELYDTPPLSYEPYYAGWDISDKNLRDMFTIHHPQGGPKEMSVSNGVVTVSNFNDGSDRAEASFWRVDQWTTGATEGGSSGAPLFNADHHVIGTLTGGSSECGRPFNDYFERLSSSWSPAAASDQQLKYWLDPINSGLKTLEGLDPVGERKFSCESMTNIQLGEVSTLMFYTTGAGYFGGYNTDSIASYAEKFFTPDSVQLTAARFNVGSVNANAAGGLIVAVYADQNNLPGASLFETYVPYSALRNRTVNVLEINPPVSVMGSFYISYTMSYSEGDMFALLQAPWRADADNTAFLKLHSGWIEMPKVSGGGSSLDIEAVVCESIPHNTNTGINTNITFYPNPAQAALIVKLPLPEGSEDVLIEIFDLQGKRIPAERHRYDNNEVISISGLNAGMYIVRMKAGGKTYQSKFIKE